jgi:hypothetical protein
MSSNTIYPKYGFVYIWFDANKKMYYVGSHWGYENDKYVCSSRIMNAAYKKRNGDFKRRILSRIYTSRVDLLAEEQRYLSMIDPDKIYTNNKTVHERNSKVRYYNLCVMTKNPWHSDPERIIEIGRKISENKSGVSIPCSTDKAKRISEARLAKRPIIDTDKLKDLFAQGQDLVEICKYFGTHKKHIRQVVSAMGYNSVMDLKPKKEKENRVLMTIEEQSLASSLRLKLLWADESWASKQKNRLSEGAKNRPPRTQSSKDKARKSQLGISKPRKS